jgi:hypothetical protein
MSTTPAVPPQNALGGPNLAAIYHTWYQGHAEAAGERPPKGEDEATAQEVADVRAGVNPLPPGATCIFDLEPMPHGCEQLYWPTWKFKCLDDQGVVKFEGVLNNENQAIPGFVGIQSPESPTSVWTKSSGYRLICSFDPLPYPARFEISGTIGGIDAATLILPWVSQK